jgi:uncharacterized protein (TIGR00730 family)
MTRLKRLCVFCGSSLGDTPAFADAAAELGRAMAAAGIELVYGGASMGLMGVIADAVLAAGGRVIGVMPRLLVEREHAHRGLSELRLVETMHERKALMAELADGFVALPGGIGTFEELFEIWTLAQLRQHQKPCALLNVSQFYDGLLAFLDQVVARQLIKPSTRALLLVANHPQDLLRQLQQQA